MNVPDLEGLAGNTYSELRNKIEQLPSAQSTDSREVQWLAGDVVGVSRDEDGKVEIFLRGPRLDCAFGNVEVNVVHDVWRGVSDERITANRLLLPADLHYDAVAAFVCTNLLDNGVLEDLKAGFARSEPVISVVLASFQLRSELLIGLCGELLVLRSLLERTPSRTRELVDSWRGSDRTARDFQVASVGAEVKTTTASLSRHRIHGVRQVEKGHPVGGGLETDLVLISIGVKAARPGEPQTNSWSLPSLVDEILSRIQHSSLAEEERQAKFNQLLERVLRYGDGTSGYDHQNPAHRAMYGQPYMTAFVRMYDMCDSAIKVLRTPDLASFSMVDAASMEFTIELPTQVHGDVNPVVGLRNAADRLGQLAWLGSP